MKIFIFILFFFLMIEAPDSYTYENLSMWTIHEKDQNGTEVFYDNDPMPFNEQRESESFKGKIPASEHIERNIIGLYPRKKISNTTSFPYRTIGLINFQSSNGLEYSCTGTLVGPRHVLTAGHCIFEYDYQNNTPVGWYQDVVFIPGQNGHVSPYNKIKAKKLLSVTGYTKHGHHEYDYGLIVLKEDIGNDIGWLSYGYKSNIVGDWLNVLGYPSDKDYGTLWKAYCPVEEDGTTSLILHYKCDIASGQSGGPMYRKSSDKRIIHGIITAEYIYWDMNIGRRISSAAYSTIKKWISKY